MEDKERWQALVQGRAEIAIELGCGNNKRFANTIGIDQLDLDNVDFKADLNQGLSFIPDNSVDRIYSNHLLEHIDDLAALIAEISRVLKTGGVKIGWVPHWSNPYFYSDPTHKCFFGLYTTSYFSTNSLYKRGVPKFYQRNSLHLEKNLLLISQKGEKISMPSRIFMKAVNFNYATQEIYERYFAKLFGIDEVYFHLKKL